MKKIVDARGELCPIPVVKAKKELEKMEGGIVEVYVDNEIAVQNLEKLATQKQIAFESEQEDIKTYRVTFTKGNSKDEQQEETCPIMDVQQTKNTVIVISSQFMGTGDDMLGALLMKGFIYALTQQDTLPKCILLYNGGAKLSIEGSTSLPDLQELETQGVEILTCGTCLKHYELEDKLGVGTVTNMYEIVEKQMQATSVIRP